MKNNHLIEVRSNCNFNLNYEAGTLHPQAEVILITTSPKYVVNEKKNGFVKEPDVSEYRFISSLDGINQLIGELQLIVQNMNNFEQSASAINAIIKANQK